MTKAIFLPLLLIGFSLVAPVSSQAQQIPRVFVTQTGEVQFKVDGAVYSVVISREGRLIGYSIANSGDFDYDIHGRLASVGDVEISYDIHGRIDEIASDEIGYDIHGRIDEIGDVSISYDIHNRLTRLGSVEVSYDLDGKIVRIR